MHSDSFHEYYLKKARDDNVNIDSWNIQPVYKTYFKNRRIQYLRMKWMMNHEDDDIYKCPYRYIYPLKKWNEIINSGVYCSYILIFL